ncbi:5-oxoprolinase subunit PxpA [Urbifossiella limnaea]|uniref:LamB/YcsF family protein n=1 Tax=Urbifossiella limnaea TaxID=2528023 RepID=A0A517XLR9_9BACT|nr:5-oxoprolinase subunit PxpA [Urbifossiella limnaea]QDU18416.1 LamB/YcsF family protein [Urbifossiella limnaea]
MLLDLNADLGEAAGFDAALMPLVTSANVCCGAHAGGPDETAATLALARAHGVAVGAHPGYPDREHFGRRNLPTPSNTLYAQLVHQLAGFVAAAARAGVAVRYVKPHGALYNQAAADAAFANVLCSAVAGWDLPVVGLPGSEVERMCALLNVPFVAEGFADRHYRPDGSLVPRTEADAFVHDPAEAVAQIERLVRERGVRTVCVHGDNPEAVAFTTAVRAGLLARGFELRAFAA